MCIILSAFLAIAVSWVTTIIVLPSACKSFNSLMTSAPVLLSKLPVGSSAYINRGLLARARATATLCI
jgi:hypothetical protein